MVAVAVAVAVAVGVAVVVTGDNVAGIVVGGFGNLGCCCCC